MKEIIYNKLVRDKIPDIIKATNSKPITHIATIDVTKELLLKKLVEELNEFKATPNVEELADLLEVVEALGAIYNLNMEDVFNKKAHKKTTRGGFSNRIVLEKVIEEE
ncbi:MAG: hypothetical protein K0Q49_1975 [Haloplasmataceae bacterium]|jgi:predicted house-cleaning noncanonical NTP pyrophosphatase (MazG superfamily)|nr:hypothetical protein [Haloplasmataceae bacterium]